MSNALYAENSEDCADDATLLAYIKSGNQEAFGELVQRHTTRFYRVAYRFMSNRSEAEDVVQDAFLKLLENPNLWNPNLGSSFTTWFYRVVVNLCLDKKKKKRPLQLDDEFQITDDRENQEEELIKQQQEQKLEFQIASLPQRQKTALTLCFYEGLSNQEAANIMGVNLKALQSLLMRAKMTLKSKLID